jgi:hypothetical protein
MSFTEVSKKLISYMSNEAISSNSLKIIEANLLFSSYNIQILIDDYRSKNVKENIEENVYKFLTNNFFVLYYLKYYDIKLVPRTNDDFIVFIRFDDEYILKIDKKTKNSAIMFLIENMKNMYEIFELGLRSEMISQNIYFTFIDKTIRALELKDVFIEEFI